MLMGFMGFGNAFCDIPLLPYPLPSWVPVSDASHRNTGTLELEEREKEDGETKSTLNRRGPV